VCGSYCEQGTKSARERSDTKRVASTNSRRDPERDGRDRRGQTRATRLPRPRSLTRRRSSAGWRRSRRARAGVSCVQRSAANGLSLRAACRPGRGDLRRQRARQRRRIAARLRRVARNQVLTSRRPTASSTPGNWPHRRIDGSAKKHRRTAAGADSSQSTSSARCITPLSAGASRCDLDQCSSCAR